MPGSEGQNFQRNSVESLAYPDQAIIDSILDLHHVGKNRAVEPENTEFTSMCE
jgi:hypothetical protein